MHGFTAAIVCYAIYRDGALFEQGRATQAEAQGRTARLAHLHPDFEWTSDMSPVPAHTPARALVRASATAALRRVLH